VDPSYLSWQVRRKLGQNFRFVELANDINDHMPDYVVQRLMLMLNKQQRSISGSTILLVGLAYKKNTGDIREAPSLRLIELLSDAGARLIAVDDHIEAHRWPTGVTKVGLDDAAIAAADIAVLLTDHDDLDLSALASPGLPLLDTKNKLVADHVERL
jgi:UDP-N-acetyl-D-mannosaminuronate dehydrogenase